MKAAKIAAIVVVAYVGIIVAFESLIGYFQPADGSTLVITTFDGNGAPHDRVLSCLESNSQLYVAANHWPPCLVQPRAGETGGARHAGWRKGRLPSRACHWCGARARRRGQQPGSSPSDPDRFHRRGTSSGWIPASEWSGGAAMVRAHWPPNQALHLTPNSRI